jgi:hypothetical protein
MNNEILTSFLEQVKNGEINISEGVEKLKKLTCEDLGFAKIDFHRHIRKGFPEVIFCPGKKPEQVKAIAEKMIDRKVTFLATRADEDMLNFLFSSFPDAEINHMAKTILIRQNDIKKSSGHGISVISAGTADMPVAEEAAITAEAMGQKVKRIYDVGVAGIHRLFSHLPEIETTNALVVVAGMEGALASVVGGLVNKPIIAVPTSIGYGANFNGLAPLLAMLNSCATGISVVNIDNGFGAACIASIIAGQIDNASGI